MSHALLYKKGNSEIVRGVKCDFIRVPFSQIAENVKQGWSTTLPTYEEENTESVVNPPPRKELSPIKLKAKELKLKKWHVKSEATLEKEIAELEGE